MAGAAARGAGLVALAVAIGVVLLWLGDDDGARLAASQKQAATQSDPSGKPAAKKPAKKPARPATSSTATSTSTSTTMSSTTTTTAFIEPADVTVLVLNGTDKANQARPLTTKLRAAGYDTLTPSDAPRRTTSAVVCWPEFQAAGPALAAATGLDATVGLLEEGSGLPGAAEASCIVVIGAP